MDKSILTDILTFAEIDLNFSLCNWKTIYMSSHRHISTCDYFNWLPNVIVVDFVIVHSLLPLWRISFYLNDKLIQ